jgi:hypothetical protein
MNTRQRTGVFVAAVFAVVAIVLHSPWSGYTVATSAGYIGKSNMFVESKLLPVAYWRTEQPLIEWFGNCLNFVAILVAVGLLAALWHRLSRE